MAYSAQATLSLLACFSAAEEILLPIVISGALYAGLSVGFGRLTRLIAGQIAGNPVILVVSTLAIAAFSASLGQEVHEEN